jgi:TonB family protein
MNAYLNYLLETSIGLCLFLLVYHVLLRKETSFRLNRIFLLIAVVASLTFPLFTISTSDSPVPSLNLSVESGMKYASPDPANAVLPEPTAATFTAWQIIGMIYAAGLLVFLIVFVIRLTGMAKALKQSSYYTYSNHKIVELKGEHTPFSFFNYIFISRASPLSEKEKQQIIEHESIHVKLYHSLDILLINALGIVFWFNPVIRIYKKIFVQLHEFEADARAVEKHDVDEYCSLLARVALQSADFKLANHFSNSLTLKRIEMMRTLKQKIKRWKLITAAAFLPILFFVIACQDQVENPSPITEEPATYPTQVQRAIDRLKDADPEIEFIVVPPSGPNLKDFEGKHAKHLSYIDGQAVIESEAALSIETGKDEKGNAIRYMIFTYNLNKNKSLPTIDQWKTASGVYEETVSRRDKSNTIDGEPIYLAVEKMAQAPGGITSLQARLKKQIHYPPGARRLGVEGRVFIKFVVKKDGSLANFEIVKGINQELDQEALRVIQLEKNWKPGTQDGQVVNSQFVMPIEFRLN